MPATFALALTATAALPVSLVVAGVTDLIPRRPWPVTRTVLFLTVFLWAETIGILLAFALWCRFALVMSRRRTAFLEANHRLQRAWARALFHAGARLFGLSTVVEGLEQLEAPGPLLVLVRHASTVDTVIPVVLLAPHGWHFRYVIKRELLLDPCLDIVGHRLPNVFVARGAGRTDEEVERVIQLAGDMGPKDALILFPEGTRFTPSKRARLLERLEASGDEATLAFARSLSATLSPLRRGSLTLLERTQAADVLVVAHTGIEAAGSMADLLQGGLIGATLRVRLWRFRAADVPREPASARSFLEDVWQGVDAFVTSAGALPAHTGSKGAE